ncbi:hypothetical protein [Streptomyces sp. NPDC059816]|uniref:hypothetical protein n=1 Tax=Streptomyces sp. NPDC059816 TaxID=3346960 RepID=UPI0036667263
MHELTTFAGALRGDGISLDSLRHSARALCVGTELSAVFRVGTGSDGEQHAVLATVGPSGGGTVARVALPRAFRVEHITHDATHFTLRVADGRTVRATPEQFGTHVLLLPPGDDPRYEVRLTEAFLATALLPDRSWTPDRTPAVHDAVLGTITYAQGTGGYGTDLVLGDQDVRLTFDGADVEKVMELLPHVRDLVAGFAPVEAAGRQFLWSWGSDGTETADDEHRYQGALRPGALVVYRSGDFEVHFDDTSGDYFLDGYWPVVRHRADRTPTSVSVEA